MDVKVKVLLTDPVFSWKNKLYRAMFYIVWAGLVRYTPNSLFLFRSFVLRCFGGYVSLSSRIYPTSKIWSARNLEISDMSTIGPRVRLYNQGFVSIGERVIISQDASICASTHDYNDQLHPLVLRPIIIKDDVWICSEAFIGPGVTVGEGAVIGARAVLTKDAEPWCVYAGNPAIKIKERKRFYE